ncbi:MAG: nucleotide exchange factor GrpE [Turneriella sp.]|nr:nucleotide exchange factor GrpE [Turneriella sp.]
MSENKEVKDEGSQGEFATEQEEIDSLKAAQAAENAAPAEGESELDILKRQIANLTGDLQRERAEFSNFRKRAQTEKAQQAAQSSARLLTDLLPALDALDQFFSVYGPKAEADQGLKAIVDGVGLVQKQISRVFTEAGVEEFNPVGEEFNPSMMEALSMLEGDVDKDTVAQVFQKGYRIDGRVIRAARVVVTKPKQA